MNDLLTDIKTGKPSASKDLFNKFFNAGVLYLRSYINDDEVTSDIVQDVLVGVWNNRHGFETAAHIKSYFYKSLRNRAINRIQRQQPSAEMCYDLADESENVMDAIIREEVRRLVAQALSRLSGQQQKIIALFMEGKTQDEISAILDISINTLKTQKRRAYVVLRNELSHLLSLLFFV